MLKRSFSLQHGRTDRLHALRIATQRGGVFISEANGHIGVRCEAVWLPNKLSSPTLVQTVRPLFSSGVMNYNCSRDVSDESADTESRDSGEGKTDDEKTLNPKEWQEIVRGYSHPMTPPLSSFMTTEKLSSDSSLPLRQEESMVGDGQTALQPEEEDYS